jgi:DNA-binding IclR family transcriptional regulator
MYIHDTGWSPLSKSARQTASKTPTVGAVSNAVAILRRLISQGAPMGVNAIARATGISPSSCFNILKTLAAERLIDFDPALKTYTPGAGLYALAPQSAENSAFARCSPQFERFAERHAMTIGLWRMTPSQRLLLVGFADSGLATRIHMTVGQRLPLLAGANGRCVASAMDMDEAEIADQFKRLRWDNPPSLKAYMRQVEETGKRGWALDDGDFLAGVTTLAVAILDRDGRPTFLLTASWFRGQRPDAEMARLASDLQALARQVSGALVS